MMSQLADGCCFPGSVDTGDHDHQRLSSPQGKWLFQRRKMLSKNIAQRSLDLGCIVYALLLDAHPQFFKQLFSGLKTSIGHDQCSLELFKKILINLYANKQAAQALASAR